MLGYFDSKMFFLQTSNNSCKLVKNLDSVGNFLKFEPVFIELYLKVTKNYNWSCLAPPTCINLRNFS